MNVDTGQFAALTEQVDQLAAEVGRLKRQVTFRRAIEDEAAERRGYITWPRRRPRHLRLVDRGGAP